MLLMHYWLVYLTLLELVALALAIHVLAWLSTAYY
jgi:hypothetical protein